MKKIISLILIVVVIFGLFSCTDEKVLTTPSNISLSEEGLITWDPVSNATSYVVTPSLSTFVTNASRT